VVCGQGPFAKVGKKCIAQKQNTIYSHKHFSEQGDLIVLLILQSIESSV
jgi:hypothetical protein